jgi:hypothetical protein
MITLKQIKKEFPTRVRTHGNVYEIDGHGDFKQRKSPYGLEIYHKVWRPLLGDSWGRIAQRELDNVYETMCRLHPEDRVESEVK